MSCSLAPGLTAGILRSLPFLPGLVAAFSDTFQVDVRHIRHDLSAQVQGPVVPCAGGLLCLVPRQGAALHGHSSLGTTTGRCW